MKSVAELCKPRQSVFSDSTAEFTLNLSNLSEGKIDAEAFFEGNFQTAGMRTLFDVAFKRFTGQSDTGVIKLTQAMGGGKTHNMLALALLAQNIELRKKILGSAFEELGEIKVLAFSGRENPPYGIWGELASQLGKTDVFKDLYTPLKAPGEGAWIRLLQGDKILILFDELPPYLENAKAITIGNSDLCKVTVTALANLFSALGKEQLRNACLVFSDLKATYESGSALLQSSFKELEHEANRVALNIEPVALNSDEIYDILRTRLFESIPARTSHDVHEIAVTFKNALEQANKSGLSGQSPSVRFTGIKDSYPFHPSIKDLYSRFKENPNFQQTRGLIRLMRRIIRQFYESKQAESASLVNVYDVDLNSPATLGFINEINSSLANAVNHDIAQRGKSVAEDIDARHAEEYGDAFPYAQNVSRLLFMSSLNEVKLGINGLTESDILGYLCEPGVDLNQYKKALEEIILRSWYLKMDNRGRYYYQNTKNMVAQMNTLVDSYSNEEAKAELIKFLTVLFQPSVKNCYEKLYVMPAVDEIRLERDKVSLVIFEPYATGGLHPDLKSFYENCSFKNRVMFLSGQKSLLEKLYENSKKRMAVEQLIKDMESEHVPASDQQYMEAGNQRDKATMALISTIVQTFETLYYPVKGGLTSDEIRFQYVGNSLKGEEQIAQLLSEARKYADYTDDSANLEILRKKCEQRIFTQKEMPWNQILERAATETAWQWYHPGQMDALLSDCKKRDKWREVGGYIQKGPFPKEPTDAQIELQNYNKATHEFTLRVRPIHGATVYYEIGAEPSSASPKAPSPFVTTEPELYFLCVDESDDPHPTGKARRYLCKAPLFHEQRGTSGGNVMRLETHPKYEIRYTTDGSNPKENGGVYNGEFPIPKDAKFVRVAVFYHDELVEEKDIPVSKTPQRNLPKIKEDIPLEYTLKSMKKCGGTRATYDELENIRKVPGAKIRRFTAIIEQKDAPENYVEISTEKVPYDVPRLLEVIDMIRSGAFAGTEVNVELEYKTMLFLTGRDFLTWMDQMRRDMNAVTKDGNIRQ